MKHILVADCDREQVRSIESALADADYEVTAAYCGTEAVQRLQEETYDLVLLDLELGQPDGVEVCRQTRERVTCPIILTAGRDRLPDALRGLEAGADDYLKKPFDPGELQARLEAHLRREERTRKVRESEDTLACSGVTVQLGARRVFREGREIVLSGREFELLTILMRNAGRPMSRQELFHKVWKTEYGDIGTVALNIKNLRAKLDPEGRLIRTIWGQGYQFVGKA